MCAENTIFAKTASWVWGQNVPGRTRFPRFWFGGIAEWRKAINESKNAGFEGFNLGTAGKKGQQPNGGPTTDHSSIGRKGAS